ncbi:hypothetical protein GCM10010430_66560 [Kitasatospora cystarginea]|uniref:Uncharacterized protein n=1 Tax=Kitasatospora cystarginea TaxID=58350 RepID=A0ABP5RTC0_9ACTN
MAGPRPYDLRYTAPGPLGAELYRAFDELFRPTGAQAIRWPHQARAGRTDRFHPYKIVTLFEASG